ncbi:hypothetical protein D1631_09300 [Chryseobacterium nematophagum]|uniref:DUF2931 family protein n=1 Tax=Chryseobacterium nematophagum TaxID=2305228 RepID=A0A3M7TF18_9FLAO|nr:hypothetical protein [Chryseobacterium nematophagum]RNA62111.1 hypothetical protein D1631_09300 [Chryseobacterium nematophagum]
MKKTGLDYFNLFLTCLFVLLLMLYGYALIKGKEFDKLKWNAEVHSTSEDKTMKKGNMIRVINADLFNNSNDSENSPEFSSPDLIYSKSTDSVYFWGKDDLLPDSLSLKYYSIDEKKFYSLHTKLPYDNLKQAIKDKLIESIVSINIKPKGKVELWIKQPDNDDFKPFIIKNFKALESTGNVEELVYRKSGGEKYNDFPGIKNESDFSDLLRKEYIWRVKVETEDDGDLLKKVEAAGYDENRIEIAKEDHDAKLQNIPKRFSIDWGDKQEYGIQYSFNAEEILTAFRKLDSINGNEPIQLTFKVYKNKYAECLLSKNGVIIPLKDLYPDDPIKYAR